MSLHFNSVEQILTQLETQPGWEKFREYRQLLKCWDRVVNQQIAQYTRPLYVNRQILYVATPSAARAQELSFQRYTLLKRLNQQQLLTAEIKDLHFSSSQWHQQRDPQKTQALFTISDRHQAIPPPAISFALKQENQGTKANNCLSPQDRAKNAAQRWLKTIEQRSNATLTCPKCNSLISQAELSRWNLCHHCVAQKWSDEYRPPIFPQRE
jgi:predicted nucleic acid-binding Zn ribbon protein